MKNTLFSNDAILDWLSHVIRVRFHIKDVREIKFSFPSEGNRTAIAIAQCGGGQNLVIKLHQSFRKFLLICYNMQRLKPLPISVPALLYWSIQSKFTRAHCYLTVEEFIAGNTISKIPKHNLPKALTQIAESLAALHSIKRHRHGWFMTPRGNGYVERYAKRTISRLSRLYPFVKENELEHLLREIKRQVNKIGKRTSYELIHGRVNDNNFLVTESSTYIIDLLTVHFGDFARDLIRALHRLCRDNSESKNLFLKQYFLNSENVRKNAYERLAPFYHCDFHIGEASNNLRLWKYGKLTEGQLRDKVRQNINESIEALVYPQLSDNVV